MQNRRIYIDLDDVLCETARALTTLLERQFGKRVAFDDMFSFDLSVSFDLSADEYTRFMHLSHEPEVLSAFEPIPGAADALGELSDMGYEIAVITGRPPRTAADSEAWLRSNDITYHDLMFVDKYGREKGGVSDSRSITLKQLSEMRFVYAVEDSGDMAAFLTGTMSQPVALLDRPWNRAYQFDGAKSQNLIDRCLDWDAILANLRRRSSIGSRTGFSRR
jgi:uncharacterized HAD superfamily protein